MPSTSTPVRRDAALAVLAVGLLVAPLWVPVTGIGGTTYRYERAEVVAENGTVAFANESAVESAVGLPVPISDEVACAAERVSRACYFERHVAANHTVLTGVYSSEPGMDDDLGFTTERYRFALVDGTVYRTTYLADESRPYVHVNDTIVPANATNATVGGESGDEGGEDDDRPLLYRNVLALEPVPPGEALERVSVPVDRVPGPVREAARTGVARTRRELDVPETPVRLDDGTYYRVYLAAEEHPAEYEEGSGLLLTLVSMTLGVALLYRLRERVDVSVSVAYRGDERQ